MYRLTTLSLAIAGCLTGLAAASADHHAETPRAIAEAWLEAYSNQDFEGMTALMTEDTVFVDPTSFDIAAITNRIEWQGPDALPALSYAAMPGQAAVAKLLLAHGAEKDVRGPAGLTSANSAQRYGHAGLAAELAV